ncbi:MAG: phosphoribosylamine--glycine ligase [Phycisphaerales bacterium]
MPKPPPCPDSCNVLLVGGGGREHALAWKLRQSRRLGRLWTTDRSNPAIQSIARQCPVEMDVKRPFHLQQWCTRERIDLVVVGPEQPLADGIADALSTPERMVFGPSKSGARMEADKAFAKNIMRQASVPTAEGRIFTDLESAIEYVTVREEPCVVKATGLAAGKGVVVCDDEHEAIAALQEIMGARVHGEAGATVLVEERLHGQEVSVMALVDGHTIWILDPAQDHKQRDEGDSGPNTGGMGAYCPTPVLDDAMLARIQRDILIPTVAGLRREGIDYRGVLYAGLMLTPGGPKVLEFNCRFGDPETQPLMARLQGDLVEICWATAAGTLDDVQIGFDPRTACCVVLCSAGYPGAYEKGRVITGIDAAEAAGGAGRVTVFHAGTATTPAGDLVTAGGRVLSVTALGQDLATARDLANDAADQIRFDGSFFRRDIGDRVLAPS